MTAPAPRLPWIEEAVRDLGGRPRGPVSDFLEDVIRLAAERASTWESKLAAERAARARTAGSLQSPAQLHLEAP